MDDGHDCGPAGVPRDRGQGAARVDQDGGGSPPHVAQHEGEHHPREDEGRGDDQPGVPQDERQHAARVAQDGDDRPPEVAQRQGERLSGGQKRQPHVAEREPGPHSDGPEHRRGAEPDGAEDSRAEHPEQDHGHDEDGLDDRGRTEPDGAEDEGQARPNAPEHATQHPGGASEPDLQRFGSGRGRPAHRAEDGSAEPDGRSDATAREHQGRGDCPGNHAKRGRCDAPEGNGRHLHGPPHRTREDHHQPCGVRDRHTDGSPRIHAQHRPGHHTPRDRQRNRRGGYIGVGERGGQGAAGRLVEDLVVEQPCDDVLVPRRRKPERADQEHGEPANPSRPPPSRPIGTGRCQHAASTTDLSLSESHGPPPPPPQLSDKERGLSHRTRGPIGHLLLSSNPVGRVAAPYWFVLCARRSSPRATTRAGPARSQPRPAGGACPLSRPFRCHTRCFDGGVKAPLSLAIL